MAELRRKDIMPRVRRRIRVKKKIRHSVKPRLVVFKSNRHIYAQIVNGKTGKTVVSASTLMKELRSTVSEGTKTSASRQVGEHIGRLAIEKSIDSVVFDRNGFLYHGRVKALAEGARDKGLKF